MPFSVVIPLFNKGESVGRTIRSVLAQTIPPSEIVVVDDGSTDNGPAIVRAIDDPRIRILHQPNKGVSAARNAGIKASRGNFVAFVDADDEWLPGHLEGLASLQKRFPASDVLASSYYLALGSRRRPAIIRGIPPAWTGELQDYFAVAINSEPPVWSSAVAVSRDALNAVGGFPEGISAGEDLLTWARLALSFRIAYSNIPSAVFHLTPAHCFDEHPDIRRKPDPLDRVGPELEKLCKSAPSGKVRSSLRRYVGRWYRMRTTSLLLAGMRLRAAQTLMIALRYDCRQSVLFCYLLLIPLPNSVVLSAFRRFSTTPRI